MRNFILEDLALSLFHTLVEPHFNYADVLYDGCTKSNSSKLQTQQNMVLRTVLNVDSRYSTRLLHEKTGVEWLDVLRKKRCCIETYKGINGISPSPVTDLFNLYVPTRELRSAKKSNLVPPQTHTAFADNNLVNRCYNYWKVLHDEVKHQPSLTSFKTAIRNDDSFVHQA